MNCNDFNKYIFDYFFDPDIDWEIRYEIEEHYFECDNCYNTFITIQEMQSEGFEEESSDMFVKLQEEKVTKLKEKGKFDEAIWCLNIALIFKPDDEKIKDQIVALEKQASSEGIDSSMDVKEESGDEFASRKIAKAKSLIKQEKPSEAIECLKDAIESLEQALIVKHDDVKCLAMLGFVYSLIHEFKKAEENLIKAHELKPYDIGILKNMVSVLYKLGKRRNAIEILEKANRGLPRSHDVVAILGEAYLLDQQNDKAEEFLELACSLCITDTTTSLINLGLLYTDSKKYTKATSVLEMARGLEPDNIAVLNNLGKVYLIINAYGDAREVLEKAYSIDSKNVAVLLNLGMAFYHLDERGKAKYFLEEANRLGPSNAAILNMLAFFYFETGDINLAQHSIETAHALDRTNEIIQHNRDIIFGKQQGELLFSHSYSSGLTIH